MNTYTIALITSRVIIWCYNILHHQMPVSANTCNLMSILTNAVLLLFNGQHIKAGTFLWTNAFVSSFLTDMALSLRCETIIRKIFSCCIQTHMLCVINNLRRSHWLKTPVMRHRVAYNCQEFGSSLRLFWGPKSSYNTLYDWTRVASMLTSSSAIADRPRCRVG